MKANAPCCKQPDEPPHEREPPMPEKAHCIAFANHKGGTGKTTSCVSIAGFLARSGRKTLVVDMDPQANATSALGIDASSLEHSVYDAVLKECGNSGVPLRQVIVDSGIENLHLAPAEFDLSAAEILLVSKPFALARLLEEVRHSYDYILIDLPTCSGMLTINGICAAEQLIAPFDPGIFALEAYDNLARTLEMIKEKTGHRVKVSMAILTRYVPPVLFAWLRGRRSPCLEMAKELKKRFPAMAVIPESTAIYRSQLAGVPISRIAPWSAAGRAYKKVARMIVEGKCT